MLLKILIYIDNIIKNINLCYNVIKNINLY